MSGATHGMGRVSVERLDMTRPFREGTLADELVEAAVAAGADPVSCRRPIAAALRLWIPQAATAVYAALEGAPLSEVAVRTALRDAAGLTGLRQSGTVPGLAIPTAGRTLPITSKADIDDGHPVATAGLPDRPVVLANPIASPPQDTLKRSGSSPSILRTPSPLRDTQMRKSHSSHELRAAQSPETPLLTPSPQPTRSMASSRRTITRTTTRKAVTSAPTPTLASPSQPPTSTSSSTSIYEDRKTFSDAGSSSTTKSTYKSTAATSSSSSSSSSPSPSPTSSPQRPRESSSDPAPASSPSRRSVAKVHIVHIDEQDVSLVAEYLSMSRDAARKLLVAVKGDVVEALASPPPAG